MLRRFSTQFKKNKDTNGDAAEPKTPKENKRFSKVSPARKSTNVEDSHPVKRGEVVAVFEKYAQAIHASREPLPNQTGDGTYLKHDQSTGLIDDIKSLGFKDIGTVKELIAQKASGELTDDKTYLMERIIQVRPSSNCNFANLKEAILTTIVFTDGRRHARPLKEPCDAHQLIPG